MTFREKLDRMISKNDSLLCVGLDVYVEKLPKNLRNEKDGIVVFNENVIAETSDVVCSYKINLAFYEGLGENGIKSLFRTIESIPKEIPLIIDGKRGDIGNTSRMYARYVFEILGGDATTVNPYMGTDSIKPFTDYHDKYVFVLCRTSNPSSREIQDMEINGKKLFEIVAERIKEWGENCGAVVGATFPEDILKIRSIVGKDRILLIPGIGTQGGDLEKSLKYGCVDGKNVIINVSRSILYAEGEFPKNIRKSAERYREEINKYKP